MDGKDVRGASRQTGDGRRMTVAAAGDRSNGIPAVRELSGGLDVTGRAVAMDAMHARHAPARRLPGRRAGHVVAAARDSQATVRDGPGATGFTGAPWHETAARGHGRPGRRRCAAVDLSGAQRDGRSALHGRRQAIRVARGREVPRTGGRSREAAWRPPRPARNAPGRRRLPGRCAATGPWKAACTACAASPVTGTAAGRTSATCRATSPA